MIFFFFFLVFSCLWLSRQRYYFCEYVELALVKNFTKNFFTINCKFLYAQKIDVWQSMMRFFLLGIKKSAER